MPDNTRLCKALGRHIICTKRAPIVTQCTLAALVSSALTMLNIVPSGPESSGSIVETVFNSFYLLGMVHMVT
jgi:hypothetical protein